MERIPDYTKLVYPRARKRRREKNLERNAALNALYNPPEPLDLQGRSPQHLSANQVVKLQQGIPLKPIGKHYSKKEWALKVLRELRKNSHSEQWTREAELLDPESRIEAEKYLAVKRVTKPNLGQFTKAPTFKIAGVDLKPYISHSFPESKPIIESSSEPSTQQIRENLNHLRTESPSELTKRNLARANKRAQYRINFKNKKGTN